LQASAGPAHLGALPDAYEMIGDGVFHSWKAGVVCADRRWTDAEVVGCAERSGLAFRHILDEAWDRGKLENLSGDETLAAGDDDVLRIAAPYEERVEDAVNPNRLDKRPQCRRRLGALRNQC